MTIIELYSKESCHLCDEARSVLESVQRDNPFTLREIKVVQGDEFYEEYKELVPVVHINKVFAFKYRVTEHMLRIKLQHLSTERQIADDVNENKAE
jgi:glutaredoxin